MFRRRAGGWRSASGQRRRSSRACARSSPGEASSCTPRGRSIHDKAETYYVEQLERQLEAAGVAVAADRLAPVVPMPRGVEQVEESPAMLPEVRT